LPTNSFHQALLHTASGAHPLALRVAASFFGRLRGLIARPPLAPDAGLLLMACPSVHTAFMGQVIDVLYLDKEGVVLKCVPLLKPWRASAGAGARTRHTLELAAGAISHFDIRAGDRLEHPALRAERPAVAVAQPVPASRQRGASLVEFAVVGPLLTLVGLTLLQYGLLFFAKSQINQASFVAARAGSTGNASLEAVRKNYAVALVPLYGGGKTAEELAKSQAAAAEDMAGNVRIELLNPTKESFAEWDSPELQKKLNTGGKRVIPNAHQSLKSGEVKSDSGQSIQDANLLKLRITHGYKMSVPVVASIYKAYQKWMDPKTDAFHTHLIEQGRVPVVSHVTLEMQSDAIEGENVSIPGKGNEGKPTDPGEPPAPEGKPPNCLFNVGCSDPSYPGGGGNPDGPGGEYCPVPVQTQINTDPLFDFGKSTLLPAGQQVLDQLIASAKASGVKSANIVGYTDQIGDEQSNLVLSEARAKAVADYLKQHGFPDVPLNVSGKGEADPKISLDACKGQDQVSCLKENRRVVVTLNR